MQFFPAVLPQGAHFSRPNSMFEMTDSRLGQDFGDLLSSQMDQPCDAGYAAQTGQSRAYGGQEKEFSEGRDLGDKRPDEASCDSGGFEEERSFAEVDAAQEEDSAAREDGAETAKAAAPKQDSLASKEEDISAAPVNERNGHDSSVHPDGGESDVSDSTAQDEAVSGEAIVAEIKALLDGLAGDADEEGLDSGNNGIKAKVSAMHELLRQFRESDPANRSELAVNLGDKIKALKAELAAMAQKQAASSGESDHTAGNSDQAASGAVQKVEALLQRLRGREGLEKGGANHALGREAAAFALAGKSGFGSADEGVRPGSANMSFAAVAAMQRTEKAVAAGQEKIASESAAASGKKSGKRSEIAMRSATREKATSDAVLGQEKDAARAESGAKMRLTPEAAENSQDPDARRQESALSSAEQKKAEGAVQTGRNESVMAREGLPAAKSRDAAPRDGFEQAANQDASSRKDEGGAVASGNNRSADSKGDAKQHDARQGFFAASDREKNSSSTFRSAQSAGADKEASQSLTQASAQNSQTSFQQRLESPVSARSAQVYQQVESGAFKNLGQGVKQLVIRLDPADLGQVSVILQVRGKEVQAVLRSSSQEASAALNEQLGQLRSQLEAQGLKVGKLEVQTQLADSQSQSQWQGSESHNRYQENQELAMSAKRWRSLERVSPDLARDVHNSLQREKLSQSGLDIFA